MATSGFDSKFLHSVRSAALTEQQEFLIQTVLHRIEPDAVASQHVSVVRGLTLDVTQAVNALDTHVETHEPRTGLLQALCRSAESAARLANKCDKNNPIGDPVLAALSTITTFKGDDPIPTDLVSVAADALRPIHGALPGYIENLFTRTWQRQKPGGWELAAFAADELAAAAAIDDRDRTSLEQDLTRVFTSRAWTSADVFVAILPLPRVFRHGVVVHGAARMKSLSILEPTARHLTGRAAEKLIWGPANPLLLRWLTSLDLQGDNVAISLEVTAPDRASAARRGHRAATELLDHYMAGHRVARLSLSTDAYTCESGLSKGARTEPVARSVPEARPLVDRWPAVLRSTMRMAHLSRDADSPLVSAALAWSAFEAAGLRPGDRRKLAKTFALQALRQQINAAHSLLAQDVASRLRYWSSQSSTSQNGRVAAQHQVQDAPPGHPKRARLAEIVANHESAHIAAVYELGRLEPVVKALEVLGRQCPVYKNGHLKDLNAWSDVLLPARTDDPVVVLEARTALAAVLTGASAATRRTVTGWHSLLATPELMASWLTDIEGRFDRLLSSVYAARNMTMHSGVFAASGDVVLGRGAELVADLLMEVLGNWYRNTDSGQSPSEVIKLLGQRREALGAKMRKSHGPADRLNLDRLTSPTTPTAWDRPPRS